MATADKMVSGDSSLYRPFLSWYCRYRDVDRNMVYYPVYRPLSQGDIRFYRRRLTMEVEGYRIYIYSHHRPLSGLLP